MTVELDGVDSGYLITHLLQERTLDTLVEAYDKDVSFRWVSFPELVKLVWEDVYILYALIRLNYTSYNYSRSIVSRSNNNEAE